MGRGNYQTHLHQLPKAKSEEAAEIVQLSFYKRVIIFCMMLSLHVIVNLSG